MSDNEYTYQQVWKNLTPDLEEEIITFWLSHKALPSRELAESRVHQVVVIARSGNGDIVGITTAYEQFSEHVGLNFYYVRAFVAETARRSKVATDIVKQLKGVMQAEFEAGQLGQSVGLFMEVENKHLRETRNQAIWPATQFMFVGKNARGDHLRVCYFAGATIS